MDNPKHAALDLLSEWGQVDAARTLEQCTVTLRHVSKAPAGQRKTQPQTDVLIAAPHDVLSAIRHGGLTPGSWPGQIERALTEAMRPHYGVRAVQWSETEPADSPRPGSFGMHPTGGRTHG